MKINDVIVLDNNVKYTLIKETVFENDKYFLAYEVKEDGKLNEEEPTVLKYVEEDNEVFVDIILSKDLLKAVLGSFPN